MKILYALCGIILLLIICVILVIFAPSGSNFYNYKDHYPYLFSYFTNMRISLINDEINESDWIDHPDPHLWAYDDTTIYKMIPLFSGKWTAVHKKYPQTSTIISQIPTVKNAFIGKIGSKSALKKHKLPKELSNNTLRLLVSLNQEIDDNELCGVWVDGVFKCISGILLYDTSKMHSMYNKLDFDVHFLILDLVRPKSILPGTAEL